MTLNPDPAGNPPTPPAGATGDPPQQPSGSSTPPPATPPTSTDWEARYKGLQTSSDRRISELTNLNQALQSKYDTLAAQFEDAQRQLGEVSTAKSTLETTHSELRGQLEQATAERERLKKTQDQQSLLLRNYPQIAPFLSFIPTADSDEKYLENAKAFAETMQSFVSTGVTATLQNAVPPAPPPKNPVPPQEDEGDRLYREAVALAGDPDKVREYEGAMQKWIAFTQKK